ncbi:MAG: hypothetical protein IPN97_11590 [Saprospiraceae bacterium]|nr:hypothetical protein [Saprospiraceae bacterium]
MLLYSCNEEAFKQSTNWTLQQCIDTAQVHNKNLQMSRNNMAIGDQREKEAKPFNPKSHSQCGLQVFCKPSYQLTSECFHPALLKENLEAMQFGVPQHQRKPATFNAFV